jgi:VanZ family protein
MTAPTWRWLTTAALAIYWLALATATHVPRAPEIPIEQGDKLVHCAAYALLAVLAAACLSAWRGPLRTRHFFGLFAALATYAALDELLQIPVGRQCDFFDWLADVVGVFLGLAIFVLARRLWKRA